MDAILEVNNLTRRFGEVIAVDHVTFEVNRGEIFGFLGPNGAGKTTTVRVLTGYLPPTDGTVLIDGCDVAREPLRARRCFSVVPEEANVYVDLTAWQNVMLMGELYGIPRVRREERTRELLELFGLGDRHEAKGRRLSKGQRQRVMLCMALIAEPSVLFLDEPTSGLDVASARVIRELVVQQTRRRGMTTFLTTHNMDEAASLCDRVAIINGGQLVAIDTPQALRSRVQARSSVEVTFAGDGLRQSDLLPLPGCERITPIAGGLRLQTSEPGEVAQHVARLAGERGLQLATLNTVAPTLEDVFLELTGEAPARGKEGGDERTG